MRRATFTLMACLCGCATTADRTGWSYVQVPGSTHPSTCHVLRGNELVLKGIHNQDQAWAKIPPGGEASAALMQCAAGSGGAGAEQAKKSMVACMREKGYSVLDEEVGYIENHSC